LGVYLDCNCSQHCNSGYLKKRHNKPWAIALGGLLGGAVGNLIDRIFRSPEVFHGHVVDFISVPNYPMFNISDSAVVLSAIAMVILSLRGVDYQTPDAIPVNPDSDQK
jgi:lipoprotein signal peptidase